MKRVITVLSLAIALVLGTLLGAAVAPEAAYAETQQSGAPDDAYAYIISPQDGEIVSSPVQVQFGLSGMGIAPAGIDVKNTGHHHLLIDVTELPELDQPLPATAQVKHFGAGQTQAELMLEPGSHTLQLVLGNYAHIPHDKPVLSDPIRITVE